ncbi:MAG: tetratricopeptide repeat protein [Elusimicrobia bacterium]|nr:tetratricopeptide repeat protein [Elusimicrobiota bacterium]
MLFKKNFLELVPTRVAVFLLPLAFVFAAGCATEQRVSNLQRQLNVLNSQLNIMQKNQADLNSKLDYLSGNLVAHAESIKDFNSQLSKISGKLDDMQTAVTGRITSLKQTISREEEENASLLPSKLYSEAYSNFIKRRYQLAAQGFSVYIEKYPGGEFTESAQYYLGDAYMGMGQIKEAAIAYATTMDKYRDSQYTPSARLKYANCLLKLPGNNKDEASKYLRSITETFPYSPEAKMAEERLTELEKESRAVYEPKQEQAPQEKPKQEVKPKPAVKSSSKVPSNKVKTQSKKTAKPVKVPSAQ